MKIQLFATTFTEKQRGENVGIGRIAAFLKNHEHDVDTVYLGEPDIAKCLADMDLTSRMFGFSVYPSNIEFCARLAEKIKENNKDAVVFFGSKMATTYYRRILTDDFYQFVDFVILGDGEYAILEMIQTLEEGNGLKALAAGHPNIACKESLENKLPAALDINKLPHPDRSWIYKNEYVTAFICDCHGCVARCSFCTQVNYYKKWNGRSAEDIFKEIKNIHDNSTVRQFMFTGGSFEDPGTMGKKKIKDLCEMILADGMKVNIIAFMRADTFHDNAEDRSLLKLMHDSGINQIVVGVEAGNDEDLKIYNKRASVEDNRRTLRLLTETGMYHKYMGFINFNPYSTPERLRQNYEFLKEVNASFLYDYTSKLMIHLDTLAYEKAREDGLINENTEFRWFEGYLYDFIDPGAHDIYEYIKAITSDLDDIARTFEGVSSYIDAFSRLIPDNEEFRNEFKDNLQRNADILNELFEPVFIANNLSMPEARLAEIKAEFRENARRIHKQQSKLTKMLYRNRVIF